MADFSGIVPALPGGGQTMSNRMQYGPGGSTNPNYYVSEFNQGLADQLNQQEALAGNGNQLYKPGGYIYGYGDPNNPNNTTVNFSPQYSAYLAGGKIIPSQNTMTLDQFRGMANTQQFVNGATYNMDQPPVDNFTQGPAGPSSQTPGMSSNQPFLLGNNGSLGSLQGTFSNTTPGQASNFYASQPSNVTTSDPTLGTFQPMSPQLQALINSR